MDFDEVLEQARQLVEQERPNASAQHKAAFCNSVAYLVTKRTGGFGGPSVRQHVVNRLYIGKPPMPFEEASRLLLADDGLIFGPLTSLHHQVWEQLSEICFDDDPQDVAELDR